MTQRRDVESSEFELDFVSDCKFCFLSLVKGTVKGWPRPSRLGATVAEWKAKNSVDYQLLHRTGLFRDNSSVISFVRYYSQFDFLQPLAGACAHTSCFGFVDI